MTGPQIPRQRPYWDVCPRCPGTVRVAPAAVVDAGAGHVEALYERAICGHSWSQVWARDDQREGWAS